MQRLELRRHAAREVSSDALSPEGRASAEDVGRSRGERYDAVFVSPGLAGQDASGGSPEGMAAGARALLDQVPDGGLGLAISHTPLVERAAFGLSGREVAPMDPCEGIMITRHDDGRITIEELRPAGGAA